MSTVGDKQAAITCGDTPRVRRSAPRVALRTLSRFCMLLVVTSICYTIVLPILSKLSSSFMIESDLYDNAVKWIPRHFTLENYRLAWEYMNYPTAFRNSLLLCTVVSALQVLSCTLVGYGFARFRFRGSGVCFGLVLLTLLVPPPVMMTPLYLNFRFFDIFGLLREPVNLINTYYPVILMSLSATGLKNGLFIYIFRQFFKAMPTELEEAAYVDGAGLFTTFARVMLPSAGPALVIVFLFAFVWQWNDYFYSSLLMSGAELMPEALEGIAYKYVESLRMTSAPGAALMITPQYLSILDSAGMILFMAPWLILYAAMQRYFVQSIERTGLVG